MVISNIDPRVIQRLADMHAVYRMFDRTGKLLYVGMTGHIARFDNHATKRWFPCVAQITLEWHDTEASARLSERRAIQEEHPRYNIAGKQNAPRRPVVAERPPEPLSRGILTDALAVFGDMRALHWCVLAERLAARFPARWPDVTQEAVSVMCRAAGVPSVDVKQAGRSRMGCRRRDIETAVADPTQGRTASTGA